MLTLPFSAATAHRETPVRADSRFHIIRITARLNVGGIARHVSWLTGGLAAAGYPTLLVTGVVPPGEEDMGSFATAQGVEPHIIPEMSRELSLKDLITIGKLYRLFRSVRPRLIHTHSAKGGAVGRVAALLYRWCTPAALLGRPRPCRIVHTYHGHIFHSYYGKLKTRFFLTIEKALARLATDRIVVISPQQYVEIHQQFGVGKARQFAVIPLGLDLAPYENWPARRLTSRAKLGAGDNDFLVGIVGRLTDIKNHRLFLEAVALFKKLCPPKGSTVRFLIIGDGQLRQGLERRAHELGVQDEVLFLGMRQDPETFYPALDVVALTSLNEGTPLTLIEGMANARPFVATAVGGVVDLAGRAAASEEGIGRFRICERGVLASSGDAEGICRGLARLLDDEALRRTLGANGLAFVRAHYAMERLLGDMTRLYNTLLGRERLRDKDLQPLLHQTAETARGR